MAAAAAPGMAMQQDPSAAAAGNTAEGYPVGPPGSGGPYASSTWGWGSGEDAALPALVPGSATGTVAGKPAAAAAAYGAPVNNSAQGMDGSGGMGSPRDDFFPDEGFGSPGLNSGGGHEHSKRSDGSSGLSKRQRQQEAAAAAAAAAEKTAADAAPAATSGSAAAAAGAAGGAGSAAAGASAGATPSPTPAAAAAAAPAAPAAAAAASGGGYSQPKRGRKLVKEQKVRGFVWRIYE